MKISRAISVARLIVAFSVLAACGNAHDGSPPQSPAAPNAKPAQPTGGEEKTTAPAKKTPEDGAQANAPVAAPVESTPTVRLIDPGKAPRRALRYAFKVGAPEWLEMDMKMVMSITMGNEAERHVAMPTVRMLMKIEATDKTSEDNVRVAFSVEHTDVLQDVGVAEPLREDLAKRMAGIVGMHGHGTISARGVASDVDFELGINASDKAREAVDNVRDAVRQLYAPLPEQEVGVGARWVVAMKMPISGAAAQLTANYELTELRTDSARANVVIEMQAPPNQPMDAKRLPPGTTATLDSMAGKGNSQVNIALTRLVGGGKGQITSDSAMTIRAQNEITHMTIHNVVDMITRSGKSPPAKSNAKK